jgi:hypothetical protein
MTDYEMIMQYHTPDLRRVYSQARDAGEPSAVAVLLINNPWMISVATGCSLGKARRLIRRARSRGKTLNSFRMLPFEAAAETLIRTCPREYAEAIAMLREHSELFLAAVLEMSDHDKNLCKGGMLRLLPIEGDMTEPDKLDENLSEVLAVAGLRRESINGERTDIMWQVVARDTDREIATGTLQECARALLMDVTAPVDPESRGIDVRCYWLNDPEVHVQVVKAGTTVFHVVAAVGNETKLHAVSRQASEALAAAGGSPLDGHPNPSRPYIKWRTVAPGSGGVSRR